MSIQANKKRVVFAMISSFLLMIIPLGVACGETTTSPSTADQNQTASSTSESFLPGEVLVTIPVYPGAVGTTLINPGFGPPSSSSDRALYGSSRPGYQSASAQYTVQATMIDIDAWYRGQLASMGYRLYGEEGGQDGTYSSRGISYFLPSQPLISVQVHIYTSEYDPVSPVFELMAVYHVPLPKPSEEILPTDIDSIQIDYAPGTTNQETKTINDKQDINSLVDIINGLPRRPDYFFFSRPSSQGDVSASQTLFALTFHSITKGNITITYTLGWDDPGIHFGDYPTLEDTHGLLKEAIEKMLGISSTPYRQ